MQKLVLVILAIANGIAVTACSFSTVSRPLEIAPSLRFELLPPASFGSEVYLTQAAEFWVNDEYHELLFYSEITTESIVIVGLMPSGTRLFSIEFDGETITSDGFGIILNALDPQYLLVDFQLSQWPLQTLITALQNSDSCFRSADCRLIESADQLHRSLLQNSVEIVSIDYSGVPHYQHSVDFSHYLRDYRLRITTLEVEQL